jgi:hypothetical protein
MANLTAEQLDCLKKAGQSFGYRLIDNRMPTFEVLQKMGLVYETVRAFYLTEAGRNALSGVHQ